MLQHVKDDWQYRFPYRVRNNRYKGASRPAYVFWCFLYYVIKDAIILSFYLIFRVYKFFLWDIWNWIFNIDERSWFIRLQQKFGIYREAYDEDDEEFFDDTDLLIGIDDTVKENKQMTIVQEMRLTFQDAVIGTELTCGQIIDAVSARFDRNRSSIIPSDYCYNRLNNGIDFENSVHLFEYTEDKTYIYLGENYPYTGKIYHKPKGMEEICVGEWENGNIVDIEDKAKEVAKRESCNTNKQTAHRTRRDVSVSMRYQIFKRDNFKCRICGASPAKDPSIELHVDHVIPWSKGGETVENNLQTLCSRCNLGKSDTL